ncbi:MAG: hypothetical protein ABR581_07705 [Thermoleophilaceae bacterium]
MLALSLLFEIILGWFAISLGASVLVIVLGSFRSRQRRRDLGERRDGPSDRRDGPADRRQGRPDPRPQRFERRRAAGDRRRGAADRRVAPV